ncbi:MAG: universal stress protein [Chitinophagaceae bacterium]|nr:universal stress protein [Chitinophagaceae bacterium]
MKNILAAVDFSDSSANAALYALHMAGSIQGASLTLLYVYESISAGSDGTPLLVDAEARRSIALTALQHLKERISVGSALPVEAVAEEGSLTANLEKYVKRNAIDLVVMGITGSTRLEQLIVGSNTLNVINKDICPVLIIPSTATYKKIQTAVFTTDLQRVEETTPLKPLKDFLDTFHPKLYAVHVATEHAAVPDEYKEEKEKLAELLKEYHPASYFLLEQDFTGAVSKFTEYYNADIIITVPRRHSFLKNLFTESHTRKLAYQSTLPILAIHSWE